MTIFESFLRENGWLGFLVYIVVKEAWPFVRDKVWPWRVSAAAADRERLKKLEDRAVSNEERQTRALESMNQTMQSVALAITTNNERMSQLIVGHADHARFTHDAISDMRETVASRQIVKRNVKRM